MTGRPSLNPFCFSEKIYCFLYTLNLIIVLCIWDNSIMHSGSIYSHINSWYRYFGMSLNLRTDGEATDAVRNYKRSCGCQVHASCAV